MDNRTNAVVGRIAELIVVHDLDQRKLKWYLPDPLSNGKDDIFAQTSFGWFGFQVKTARDARRPDGTYYARLSRQTKIESDVLVLVSRAMRTIQYMPWGKLLPPELPTGPVPMSYLGGRRGSKVHSSSHASEPEQRP